MKRSQFDHIKAQVTAATAGQILELEAIIEHFVSEQATEMALARRTRQTVHRRICPHCQGHSVVLHGKDQNGRQRFKCRGCRRTYNIMTGTPMARARKPELWGQYLACMTAHLSVRRIVASGVAVHQVTAWRWRHRFLEAAANDNAAILSGVIESDEIFFPWSFKGSRGWKEGKPPEDRAARSRSWRNTMSGVTHQHVPVLTAVDNSGQAFSAILTSSTDIEATLAGRIAPGSVLCSNGKAAYATVADTAKAQHYKVLFDVEHVSFSLQRPGWLGLGRVNTYHQRLRYLIYDRCRGVATKYLCNYIGWHRAMMRSGFEGSSLLSLALA